MAVRMKSLVLIFGLIFGLILSGCGSTQKKNARINEVIEVYRQASGRAEQCYRDALLQDPSINGKLVLAWKVDHTGKAQNARIERTDVVNKFLEDCVLNHLKEMEFPKQPHFSPAQVEYEFDFRRQTNP